MANVRRWLVTGGCGFIGAALVRMLASDAHNAVRVLDNLSIRRIANLALLGAVRSWDGQARQLPDAEPGVVDVVVGDICDAATFRRAAVDCDIIVHLAANSGVVQSIEDPVSDCRANVVGTLNGLEAARVNRIKRFVLASSGAVLADAVPPFDEEQIARPNSPYGASKRSAELYCRAYSRSFGLNTMALRFSNVYGPGSRHKGSVIAAFIKQAVANRTLVVEGDGTQTRDFIYLDDLLAAIRKASLREGIAGEVFHNATGIETRVSDVADLVKDALARAGVPDVAVRHAERRSGDVARNFAGIERATRQLDWTPLTPLRDGIEATVKWFMGAHAARG